MSSCKTLIQALVIAHLDYYNSAYIGIPDNQLMKLQRVQNIAAKVTFSCKMHDSAMDCLITLHWLLYKFCIIFKAMCLVYKGLNGLAPKYIRDMFHVRASKGRHHDKDDVFGIDPAGSSEALTLFTFFWKLALRDVMGAMFTQDAEPAFFPSHCKNACTQS